MVVESAVVPASKIIVRLTDRRLMALVSISLEISWDTGPAEESADTSESYRETQLSNLLTFRSLYLG